MPVLLVLALAACPKPQGTTTSGGAEVAPKPSGVPFEQLDHDQRIAFMKEQVVPTMKPIFQQHDAREFAEFGCKTCHGDGADQGEFHMPNDKLPLLNFSDMSQFKKADIEWMTTVVKPTMARLLMEEEASPARPDGFGCVRCHPAVE